jgi:hypothetical protein
MTWGGGRRSRRRRAEEGRGWGNGRAGRETIAVEGGDGVEEIGRALATGVRRWVAAKARPLGGREDSGGGGGGGGGRVVLSHRGPRVDSHGLCREKGVHGDRPGWRDVVLVQSCCPGWSRSLLDSLRSELAMCCIFALRYGKAWRYPYIHGFNTYSYSVFYSIYTTYLLALLDHIIILSAWPIHLSKVKSHAGHPPRSIPRLACMTSHRGDPSHPSAATGRVRDCDDGEQMPSIYVLCCTPSDVGQFSVPCDARHCTRRGMPEGRGERGIYAMLPCMPRRSTLRGLDLAID